MERKPIDQVIDTMSVMERARCAGCIRRWLSGIWLMLSLRVCAADPQRAAGQ